MQNLLCLAALALAGCPAPARYIVADVTVSRTIVPVEGAMVAAECGQHHRGAQRTDDAGRARLRVHGETDRCALIVAKPGFTTVETGPVSVCPTPGACAPSRVELAEAFAAPLAEPPGRRLPPRPTDWRPADPKPVETPPTARPIHRMEVAQ